MNSWPADGDSQIEMSARSDPERTPRELGYRMPAEWEPHDATWLAWPHNPEDWPGKFQPIPWVYAEIVRLLAARERVHHPGERREGPGSAHTRILKRAGANLDQVTLPLWPTDRVWTRDSGPIFVRKPGPGSHHELAFQCLGKVLQTGNWTMRCPRGPLKCWACVSGSRPLS